LCVHKTRNTQSVDNTAYEITLLRKGRRALTGMAILLPKLRYLAQTSVRSMI